MAITSFGLGFRITQFGSVGGIRPDFRALSNIGGLARILRLCAIHSLLVAQLILHGPILLGDTVTAREK